MLFTVAEHHRNLKFLTLFGPITQKRDFGQKKCIPVKLFKMGQKTYRNLSDIIQCLFIISHTYHISITVTKYIHYSIQISKGSLCNLSWLSGVTPPDQDKSEYWRQFDN